MTKLIMLRGISGSGKTTLAQKYIDEENFIRLNADAIREMFFGTPLTAEKYTKSFKTPHLETLIFKTLDELACELLHLGLNVIIDNTNLTRSAEDHWRTLAEHCHADFEVIAIETPIALCKKRDAQRERSVGPIVILRQAETLEREYGL